MAHKRILIVHNDPDMVAALRLPLQSAGYEVLDADSNEEGLQKVTGTTPDLIILDATLEVDHDPQVSLTLRNRAPHSAYAAYQHIPILVLTPSHTTASLRVGADEAYLPVDDYVDKPIEPDVLLEKVRVLIG